MKIFKCPHCNSQEIFTEENTNQAKSYSRTGLYCADCGKWIKWLTKDEIRLAKRQEEYMKDTQFKQIALSMQKGKEIV